MSCCKRINFINVLYNVIKNNIYFDIFFIGVICQFSILLAITIDFYQSRDGFIWFCSKILTIKKIIKDNYDNYKIYQTFKDFYVYHALKYSYYDLLKNSSKNECGENLKQCGILDTYGNKLCLYKDYPCPINEIIIDLKEKSNEYKNKGYKNINYYPLKKNNNYSIYYTNTSYDMKIINTLFYANPPEINIPYRFIGSHNFIFDTDAFEQKYEYKNRNITINSSSTNVDNITDNVTNTTNNNETIKNVDELNYTIEIDGEENENELIWSDVSEIKIRLMQSSGLEDYIDNELNKTDNNNDKNYTQIFNNIYIKNFVGFENPEQMDIFKNTDFTIYKSIFPHNIRLLLVIVSEVLLVIIIIIYIRKLVEDEEKDNDNDNNICKKFENFIIIFGISIYCLIFLYFYTYFIFSCYELNKNNKFSELKEIKADKYIEEFINEFISKFKKKRLICCSILFFSLSLVFYIISIVLYINKIKEKIKVKEPQNDNSEEKRIPYQDTQIDNSSQSSSRELERRNNQNKNSNIKKEDNCFKRILKCDIFKKH